MKSILMSGAAALVLAAPALAQDGPMGGPMGGPMDPGMMFEMLDADSDGTVTQAEVDAAKAARFATADANSDGKLDQAEMVAQAEAMQAEMMARMQERMKTETSKRIAHMMIDLDTDSDGFLTIEEMSDNGMERMFVMLDTDEDGAISQAEFDAMKDRVQGMRGKHGGGFGGDRNMRGRDGGGWGGHGRDGNGWFGFFGGGRG